jgi:hypothetical protein
VSGQLHAPAALPPEKDDLDNMEKLEFFTLPGGHAVAQWLRHYATNRKVTGLIPDEVNF